MNKPPLTVEDIGTKVVFRYTGNFNRTEYCNATLKAITADGKMVRLSFGFLDLEYFFGGGWYSVDRVQRVQPPPDPQQKKLPYREYIE